MENIVLATVLPCMHRSEQELRALAMEYRRDLERMQQRLLELKELLPQTYGEPAFMMQRRIELLQAEIYEVRYHIYELEHYYQMPQPDRSA